MRYYLVFSNDLKDVMVMLKLTIWNPWALTWQDYWDIGQMGLSAHRTGFCLAKVASSSAWTTLTCGCVQLLHQFSPLWIMRCSAHTLFQLIFVHLYCMNLSAIVWLWYNVYLWLASVSIDSLPFRIGLCAPHHPSSVVCLSDSPLQ